MRPKTFCAATGAAANTKRNRDRVSFTVVIPARSKVWRTVEAGGFEPGEGILGNAQAGVQLQDQEGIDRLDDQRGSLLALCCGTTRETKR